MNRLIPVLVFCVVELLANGVALADQCQQVSTEQANKAATLLPAKAQILWYCPPCGDKAPSAWQSVGEVAVLGSGNAPREVRINGKAVDLAYVFFAATDGKAYNLALQAGCQAVGVPAALDLQQPQTATKRYKLSFIVEILSSKADGKRWDPAGDPPDPLVKAYVQQGTNKPRIITCRQKDTVIATCTSGTIIDADQATTFSATIEDEDAMSNDFVGGTMVATLADAIAGKLVTLKTSGQIKTATLKLEPVE